MRVRAVLLAVLVLALLPAVASADYAHLVRPGETLTSVAATDDLSIEAIAAANHISPQAELIAGQILMIPPQTPQTEVVSPTSSATSGSSGVSSAAETSTTTTQTQSHVVQPGETLTSVAAANGVSIAAIAAANHISPRSELIAGKTLLIPTAATSVQSTTSQSSTSSEPTGSESAGYEASEEATEGQSASTTKVNASYSSTQSTGSGQPSTNSSSGTAAAGGPQPTMERVSGSEIAGVADANAVPAALAEAIAWQESGWNNAEVSNIGAVGVMQIVPSTWNWIDRFLTPANPLGTASASENIRAGVLLLHQLLQITGGNEQLAVAGYYQGLGSVKRFGMYASTRRYVADVLALAQRF